ncbi:MAG: hypothetical protein JWR77_1236, partial [Rhizorhabdus sp.]|nr:hypothetical protein [Rhizorhabdus sp.]
AAAAGAAANNGAIEQNAKASLLTSNRTCIFVPCFDLGCR